MKTRSNMPLFVVECNDIKALSNSQIDLLRCGDYLVKKDASGEHAYKVTYKSDTGMCLTYHDASVIETQSYDKVNGNWVYNSEDKTPNLLDAKTKPIYCHPLTYAFTIIISGISYTAELCSIIFNNSSEIINTKDKLIATIDQFGVIAGSAKVLMCSGALATLDESGFYLSARSVTKDISNLFLEGIDNKGVRHTSGNNPIDISNVTFNYIYDAVNQIN